MHKTLRQMNLTILGESAALSSMWCTLLQSLEELDLWLERAGGRTHGILALLINKLRYSLINTMWLCKRSKLVQVWMQMSDWTLHSHMHFCQLCMSKVQECNACVNVAVVQLSVRWCLWPILFLQLVQPQFYRVMGMPNKACIDGVLLTVNTNRCQFYV